MNPDTWNLKLVLRWKKSRIFQEQNPHFYRNCAISNAHILFWLLLWNASNCWHLLHCCTKQIVLSVLDERKVKMVLNVHRNRTEWRGRLYTYRYNVTTRMIPALRRAAMTAIHVSFIVRDKVTIKTVSTNHNLSEEKGELKRYQTEVLLHTSLTPYR